MSVRLVSAPISLVFNEAEIDKELYLREFEQLSDIDKDPINQWLKLAKAKGELGSTDPILLNLVVELHKKIDALERFLKNEEPKRILLVHEADIESIGFEYFKLKEPLFHEGMNYYGRVQMPIHPKRDIAVFFTAMDSSLAKITKIHNADDKEWSSYLTSRERLLIREAREKRE